MKAIALNERQSAPSRRTEEPLYFSSGDHQLFGWLHHSAAESDLGLVICKPLGYESICAHRSIAAFAQVAATIGMPALRFDYAGTGDSQDMDSASDEFAIWTQDVLAAVRELRRRTGVRRVCLLGFRLGATLATLAAAQCEEVKALIVVAPVINGRRYLRELRVIQLAASQAVVVAPTPSEGVEESNSGAPATGSLEVSGFQMTPPTITALSQLDLMTLPAAPAEHVLVIDRNDLPGARAYADALHKLGAQVDYACLSGIVEMMWTAPHFAVIPQAMVGATRDWLLQMPRSAVPQADGVGRQRSDCPEAARASTLRLRPDPGNSQSIVTERAVFLPSEPEVFGVVSEPSSGESRRRGVILLNDGATYHIGANRLYVSLARRWAGRGYTVLRMDLAGLGDSAPRPGRPANEVFPPAALDDVGLAIEFMRSQYGVDNLTIGGLCAGAYHALRAALAPLSVSRILLVNPQVYFWKEGMKLQDLQLAEVVRKRVLSAYWLRLLSGEVDVWRVAKIYVRRAALVLEATLRNVARRVGIRLPRDLGSQLEEVAARGVRIVFAFSRDDAGIELLKLQAGSSVRRLGERCRIHIIDGADHIFSQSGPRQELENFLSEELLAPTLAGRSSARAITEEGNAAEASGPAAKLEPSAPQGSSKGTDDRTQDSRLRGT